MYITQMKKTIGFLNKWAPNEEQSIPKLRAILLKNEDPEGEGGSRS